MTVKLTGDFPSEYRNDDLNEDIDATGATFHQRHGPTGDYPFNITCNANGVVLQGGTMLGGVPEGDWRTLYEAPNGNSAAIRVNNGPGAVVRGWHFKPDPKGNAVSIVGAPASSLPRYVWDGIRFNGTSDDWVVEDIFMEGCRDDAIENEHGGAGIVRNSRFFDCFVFMATHGLNASGKTVTVQNCLVSMGLHSYKGKQTHQSPFKANSSNPNYNPDFVLDNVVIAIRDPNHEGGAGSGSRLGIAFARMTAVDCHFLNLSNTPLPSNYPARPAGFTTLQGQAARDYWDARVAAWGGAPDPEPEDKVPTPEEWNALLARVDAAEAAAIVLSSRADALEIVSASTTAQIAGIESRVTALENATAPGSEVTQAELNEVAARVRAVEVASATMATDLARLDGRLDAVASGAAD